MKYTLLAAVFIALSTLVGCSGTLSSRAARQQIANLGGSTLVPDEIAIQRIIIETGNRAIAETNVKMTFQFEKDQGGNWEIISARLGDRHWIEVGLLLESIERQYTEGTSDFLKQLSIGVEQYRTQNGSLPELVKDSTLIDILYPGYVEHSVNQDAWGHDIQYERRENGAYMLRSPGPDGIHGNADDIIIGN